MQYLSYTYSNIVTGQMYLDEPWFIYIIGRYLFMNIDSAM